MSALTLTRSAIISTALLASGCVWFTPVCTALICGLSQVTLFKVLNSRRDIREREGLVTTAVPTPPTAQRICVSVKRVPRPGAGC